MLQWCVIHWWWVLNSFLLGLLFDVCYAVFSVATQHLWVPMWAMRRFCKVNPEPSAGIARDRTEDMWEPSMLACSLVFSGFSYSFDFIQRKLELPGQVYSGSKERPPATSQAFLFWFPFFMEDSKVPFIYQGNGCVTQKDNPKLLSCKLGDVSGAP